MKINFPLLEIRFWRAVIMRLLNEKGDYHERWDQNVKPLKRDKQRINWALAWEDRGRSGNSSSSAFSFFWHHLS